MGAVLWELPRRVIFGGFRAFTITWAHKNRRKLQNPQKITMFGNCHIGRLWSCVWHRWTGKLIIVVSVLKQEVIFMCYNEEEKFFIWIPRQCTHFPSILCTSIKILKVLPKHQHPLRFLPCIIQRPPAPPGLILSEGLLRCSDRLCNPSTVQY